MTILILTAGLALLVGFTLGLLGGGGSILAVPLLAYIAGMSPQEAIAGSLFVITVTSLLSMIFHARHGNVRWRTGLIFGAASMVGAFSGGLVGVQLPGRVLMIAFALMMVATAAAMLRRRRDPSAPKAHASGSTHSAKPASTGRAGRAGGWILVDGLVVGFVTGMVGAGGGFLVVPALALLAGLSMPVAVGTSLMVITLKSAAGFAGYATAVSLDWSIILPVTVMAVLGSLVGSSLTRKLPEALLRRAFGIFVIIMGGVILVLELT